MSFSFTVYDRCQRRWAAAAAAAAAAVAAAAITANGDVEASRSPSPSSLPLPDGVSGHDSVEAWLRSVQPARPMSVDSEAASR